MVQLQTQKKRGHTKEDFFFFCTGGSVSIITDVLVPPSLPFSTKATSPFKSKVLLFFIFTMN